MVSLIRKLAVIVFIGIWIPLNAQIDRVEPPNWWSEMQRSELQIVLYGEKLARYEIQAPDLILKNVIRTENPNYLFVTVDTRDVKAGTYRIHLLENKQIVHTIDYQFLER